MNETALLCCTYTYRTDDHAYMYIKLKTPIMNFLFQSFINYLMSSPALTQNCLRMLISCLFSLNKDSLQQRFEYMYRTTWLFESSSAQYYAISKQYILIVSLDSVFFSLEYLYPKYRLSKTISSYDISNIFS